MLVTYGRLRDIGALRLERAYREGVRQATEQRLVRGLAPA